MNNWYTVLDVITWLNFTYIYMYFPSISLLLILFFSQLLICCPATLSISFWVSAFPGVPNQTCYIRCAEMGILFPSSPIWNSQNPISLYRSFFSLEKCLLHDYCFFYFFFYLPVSPDWIFLVSYLFSPYFYFYVLFLWGLRYFFCLIFQAADLSLKSDHFLLQVVVQWYILTLNVVLFLLCFAWISSWVLIFSSTGLCMSSPSILLITLNFFTR